MDIERERWTRAVEAADLAMMGHYSDSNTEGRRKTLELGLKAFLIALLQEDAKGPNP